MNIDAPVKRDIGRRRLGSNDDRVACLQERDHVVDASGARDADDAQNADNAENTHDDGMHGL